jgi:hypothetical protein
MMGAFLDLYYTSDTKANLKQVRIISCEQICGQHLRLESIHEDIRKKLEIMANEKSSHVHVKNQNKFTVKGPNYDDITISANGKSPWYLVKGYKNRRHQIDFLLLGHMSWGMEASAGLRMKKSVETHGKEKVMQFLKGQVESMVSNPDNWEDIELYYR